MKTSLIVCALASMVCLSPVIAQTASPKTPATAPATAPAAKDAGAKVEIPVTRVVLFSSGVGYLEHSGNVTDDASATLMFKSDEMNDVLKSMVLMDLDKGSVSSVKFPSRDPLTHALKSFGVDLSTSPDMADLLKQLRGVQVTVSAPEKVVGKVLTVETRERQVVSGGVTTILKENYLNLVTDKGIIALPMSAVSHVQVDNGRLSDELNKALELLIESRDMSRKPVDIQFTGKGKRRVLVGYVTETPIWKTSYRLDMSGKDTLLQGWAIIENTSDQDWANVNLSLVSGRPISFVQDLYTPLYMPRPVVVPELYASLRPPTYDEGISKGKDGKLAEDKVDELRAERAAGKNQAFGGRGGAPSASALPASPGIAYAEKPSGGVSLEQSMQSIASATKVGELFEFTIKEPVNLQRRRSAMLPIVNSPVKAERVSIYNQSVLPKNPLNGAYLTNSTEMKLPAGPITVFDDGAYAGDARLDNFVPGDKRLISYAVDLNVLIDPSQKSSESIVGVKIVRGALEVKRLQTFTQTYAVKNKATDKRTLIIEHPIMTQPQYGGKLVEPDKFEEKTPALYRFRVEVDKSTTKDFVVKEEQTIFQTVGILAESIDTLMFYSKSGKLSDKVAAALAKAIQLKQDLAALQQEYQTIEKQLNDIKSGQDRLRKNLETVGKESELGRRYLTKLNDEETQIETLTKQLDDLRTKIQAAQKALADYLKDLNIE